MVACVEPDFCSLTNLEDRQALTKRQLAAVGARERKVRAFVCHDAESASRQIVEPEPGPLSGALVGVKDIITTAQFPTQYGFASREDLSPRVDAWSVARTRRLGGIVLGKTVCSAFGMATPGPTTNPSDTRRTPGGSSSGSAAAVAAGFVSFALGSQTAGSTIRPASYCGVTGYKPTYGLLHTAGLGSLSITLDHLGIFARSPRDAWYFASALALSEAEIISPRKPKRILMLRMPGDLAVRDNYPERLTELARAVAWEGVDVTTLDLPFPLDDFANLQKRICYWEAARILLASAEWTPPPELISLFAPYMDVDISVYASARYQQSSYQAQFQELACAYDAVLMPAATGAAPLSLADTGDAVLNRFWTALHVPVLSIPLWTTEDGAPLGLQVIGTLGDDRSLCETAQWLVKEYADRCWH